MKLLPEKSKSIKDIIMGLFLSISAAFGFAHLNGYEWQAAIVGGLIFFVFLILIPSLIINLLCYWRDSKS